MIFSIYFNGEISEKNVQVKKIENRGKIFDRNGILLASTVRLHSLFAHPKKIKEKNNLSGKLEEILSIPKDNIKVDVTQDKAITF